MIRICEIQLAISTFQVEENESESHHHHATILDPNPFFFFFFVSYAIQFRQSIWYMSLCLEELPRMPHLVFRNWVKTFVSTLSVHPFFSHSFSISRCRPFPPDLTFLCLTVTTG